MQKGGEKKLYWSFTPFLPGIPISLCGLSSTFVDKSHICVPFWRLLIVLNWRNYSQGTAVSAIQRCWWPDCAVRSLALYFINLEYPLLLSTTCPFWATPLGMSSTFSSPLWYPALFHLLYLNAIGDKCQSWSPQLSATVHTQLPAPLGSHTGPNLLCLPTEKGNDGHYVLLQSRASDRAGPSAKYTSMPCSHEQRWWNKFDIWARMGSFYLQIHAQQFPRWLLKLHKDSQWIIHYLPSISVHSNRQQISSCHAQGYKSICLLPSV